MTDRAMRSFAAVSAHARSVSASDRAELADALERHQPDGVVLITCHRVEAFGRRGDAALELAVAGAPGGVRRFDGDDAVRHLVRVAVGRDSAVLGEDEILHQLRRAVDDARDRERLDPLLERLMTRAVGAGRTARSWQQRRRRSLGDVAVAAIRDRVAAGDRPLRVLVVGAGTMGALATRAALAARARVSIANRTRERAVTLAKTSGAGVVPIDPGQPLADVDGVILAISGRWSIGPESLRALRSGSPIVVDLSFPPAAAELETMLGDRYVSADALARTALEDAPPDLAARLDALIDDTVADIRAWSERGGSRAVAAALVELADQETARELERLWQQIPAVDPTTRAAIEDMTRHLAARLLRPPLEQLGRDRDDRASAAVRELFAL